MTSAPVGRPSKLTEEVAQRILQAIPEVFVLPQIAALSRVPKTTLVSWLEHGRADLEKNIDSDYAEFSCDFEQVRAQAVRDLLYSMQMDGDRHKVNTWILEKCFREDFGKESEEMRELRALFLQLLPTLSGVQANGQQTKVGNTGAISMPSTNGGQAQ